MKAFALISILFSWAIPTNQATIEAPQRDVCDLYGVVFVESVAAFADHRVFVEDTEGFADLVVFKEDNEAFANERGHWHITTVKAFADFTIYVEDVKGFADFSIAYTDFRTAAGCQ
ncbi:MAG: hypothetical protein AAF927_19045 [Bacteroidota bacterium]